MDRRARIENALLASFAAIGAIAVATVAIAAGPAGRAPAKIRDAPPASAARHRPPASANGNLTVGLCDDEPSISCDMDAGAEGLHLRPAQTGRPRPRPAPFLRAAP